MVNGTEVWKCLNCGRSETSPRQGGHGYRTFLGDLRCENIERRVHRCDPDTEGIMVLIALRGHSPDQKPIEERYV